MGRAEEPTAKGVSLWLLPAGELRDRLSAWIEELARRYRTPVFPPHLTLLPGIAGQEEDALARAGRLASSLEPLAIRLLEVGTSDSFFRCVFLRAELSEALQKAHLLAREAFPDVPAAPFLPHLSLLYGQLGPKEKRAVRGQLPEARELAFSASSLHVFRTKGPPRDWRGRGEFPLGR
jgi:2'-5' RNA ligase